MATDETKPVPCRDCGSEDTGHILDAPGSDQYGRLGYWIDQCRACGLQWQGAQKALQWQGAQKALADDGCKKWSYIEDQHLFHAMTLVLGYGGCIVGTAIGGLPLGIVLLVCGIGLGIFIAAELVAQTKHRYGPWPYWDAPKIPADGWKLHRGCHCVNCMGLRRGVPQVRP